jgi:uncharacterized membrane protein
VLFAKHAQHVVLIHFPIALFIIGVLFDFLSRWKNQRLLAAAAYYNLLVAAIATLPVVVTGILATQSVLVLKRNDPSALLKGHESFREFAACPVIGGSDSTATSY